MIIRGGWKEEEGLIVKLYQIKVQLELVGIFITPKPLCLIPSLSSTLAK